MGATRATNPWATWRGQPSDRPTDAECFASCKANAQEAAKAERRARDWYARAQKETADCGKAWEAIVKAVSDQRHWQRLADFYGRQLDAAKTPPVGPSVRPPVAREPGEDDDDERPVSAWEDIGGGARP